MKGSSLKVVHEFPDAKAELELADFQDWYLEQAKIYENLIFFEDQRGFFVDFYSAKYCEEIWRDVGSLLMDWA